MDEFIKSAMAGDGSITVKSKLTPEEEEFFKDYPTQPSGFIILDPSELNPKEVIKRFEEDEKGNIQEPDGEEDAT